ncbi:unnamed protein product [Rotaria sp. Silwood2]|nr:unnamed protein product [Rotaria sp. Silwood2]
MKLVSPGVFTSGGLLIMPPKKGGTGASKQRQHLFYSQQGQTAVADVGGTMAMSHNWIKNMSSSISANQKQQAGQGANAQKQQQIDQAGCAKQHQQASQAASGQQNQPHQFIH